ncbi:hypothetical protein [Bacillus sp. S/N-304-OC-R1]|uniref:hypothetical protein n=1 Tax=Bacillus sp. S/N-304-OC-R1 TaxID=2758034 RepID=UPI001C8EB0A3|nr:hypothetical protein [Bacillus sp. S/N-304-OC-R1]MBY0122142.1 hypothetical protein [Bacillus sp. S/N-304-OC-R1]
MHLIIYKKSNGEPLLQETISSFFTTELFNTKDSYEYVVKHFGGKNEEYSEIWLDDETTIQKTYTHEFKVQNGEIVFGNERIIEEPPREPTSGERIELLEQEKLTLQLALAETIEKQEMDKISNQLALAELIETLTIKGVL